MYDYEYYFIGPSGRFTHAISNDVDWDRLGTSGKAPRTKETVTPQKYPRIFIIKLIIYSEYNWANLGIIFFYY